LIGSINEIIPIGVADLPLLAAYSHDRLIGYFFPGGRL
jgi:hypothetical protein